MRMTNNGEITVGSQGGAEAEGIEVVGLRRSEDLGFPVGTRWANHGGGLLGLCECEAP